MIFATYVSVFLSASVYVEIDVDPFTAKKRHEKKISRPAPVVCETIFVQLYLLAFPIYSLVAPLIVSRSAKLYQLQSIEFIFNVNSGINCTDSSYEMNDQSAMANFLPICARY